MFGLDFTKSEGSSGELSFLQKGERELPCWGAELPMELCEETRQKVEPPWVYTENLAIN